MASGDIVGHIHAVSFPATVMATPDFRPGGSTPNESIPVWDFDAAADEHLDLLASLEGYDGGGLTIKLRWMASSAASGAVVWKIAVRRIADDAEDVDGSHSYSYNTVTVTTASASGEVDYAEITFADGADMDSLADGEFAIVRVGRDADNGSDTMTGDAELLAVVITET